MLGLGQYFSTALAGGTALALTLGATGVAIQQAFQDVDAIAAHNVASHTQAASLMHALDTGIVTNDERVLAAAGYLDLEARDKAFADAKLHAQRAADDAAVAAQEGGAQ